MFFFFLFFLCPLSSCFFFFFFCFTLSGCMAALDVEHYLQEIESQEGKND